MNKSFKLLLCLAPLALCGCDFNFSSIFSKQTTKEETNESSPSNGSNEEVTPSENDLTDTDVTPVDPVVTDKIESMTMSGGFITLKKGKYEYVAVNIVYAEGYDWETAGDEIEWITGNSSIATVNENGKVVAVSKGHTTLTARLKVSHHTCSTTIYVIENDSDITKTWKKLGATDEINDNDSIIIACSQESKAATNDDTGHKLHTASISLSSDKNIITNIGDAAEFYVYRDSKGRDGYNFEELGSGKYLGCSNTANVSYFDSAKSSQTVWSVEYDNDNHCWDMRSSTNVDGWMMYNKDIDRFANYQSNETDYMFVVSLYRLTYTYNV